MTAVEAALTPSMRDCLRALAVKPLVRYTSSYWAHIDEQMKWSIFGWKPVHSFSFRTVKALETRGLAKFTRFRTVGRTLPNGERLVSEFPEEATISK